MLEEAALLRIPSGPVLDGSTVPGFEQFVSRGVFQKSPSGRFSQPRVPYRISGTEPPLFRAAPSIGEHTGVSTGRPPTGQDVGDDSAGGGDGGWRLPLDGVRVIDCTAWWAGPASTNVLACLGADVVKVESVTRPDYMRFASTRHSR